jgi:hypothetical protein
MIAGVIHEVVKFKLDDGNVFGVRKSENQLYLIPNEEIIKTARQLRSLANAQLKSRLSRLEFLKKSQEYLAVSNGRVNAIEEASRACKLSQKLVSNLYSLSESRVGGSSDVVIAEWLYILKFFHLPIHVGSEKIAG